ncbi:MAG: SDR family oxidoreductase [Mariprofundales bacterium]|nr:SDR family oxidoreductase [Mariprofundales bacterium]
MNVVITGAGRGIGYGFVEYYLARGDAVWATFRSRSAQLERLLMERSSAELLHLMQWDVTKRCPDMPALPAAIDLLINCAGIYGPGKGGQDLGNISAESMQEIFLVDCVAPLLVVQQLQQRVVQAGGVIANISSKMGSIADNSSGGTYGYRAAKAGLVMVSKSLAVDLAPCGVHVLTLHPVWVRTDMTGGTGLIDIERSVQGMGSVLQRAREFTAGSFIAYDGQLIPY